MKSRKNLLIIIGTGLVVLGLALAIPAAVMGAATGFGYTSEGLFLSGSSYARRVGSEAKIQKNVTVEEYSLPDFSSIKIDIAYTNIVFEKADKPGLKLQYKEGSPLSWSVENNILNIVEKRSNKSMFRMVYFDLDYIFSFGNIGREEAFSPLVTVYLPAGTRLDSLDIITENSGCDLSGLTVESLNIKNSYGSIRLSDISSNSIEIKGENTEMSLSGIKGDSMEMRNSYGSLQIDTASLEQLSLNSENCDFSLQNGNIGSLTLKNSYGVAAFSSCSIKSLGLKAENCTIRIEDSSIQSSDIKNSYGSITAENFISGGFKSVSENCDHSLSGSFSGETAIDSAYGDIVLETALARSQYSWDIKTQYGSAIIDGDTIEGSSRNEAKAENHILIRSESSDVTINFS